MVPLIVHLLSFFIMLYLGKLASTNPSSELGFFQAGRTSIGVMFIVTGISHFALTESMVQMFPEFVPFKYELVYLSGVFEVICGSVLAINSKYNKSIGICLMLFLLFSLPLNINSAIQGTGLGAKGVSYLLFRVPLQIFWFAWLWFFTVRHPVNLPNPR